MQNFLHLWEYFNLDRYKILIEGIDIFPQIACDHAKWAGLDFPDCSYCGQFSFNKSSAEPRIFSLKLLTFTKAVDFRNKVKSPKETREIIWGLLTWKQTHKVHIILASNPAIFKVQKFWKVAEINQCSRLNFWKSEN